ncbi:MAG TPA: hypothetical protein VMA71_01370 [Alloacidobacterium sp.]|nr:hypothetical protein [Alloacidobacterium sp.]
MESVLQHRSVRGGLKINVMGIVHGLQSKVQIFDAFSQSIGPAVLGNITGSALPVTLLEYGQVSLE